MKTAFRHRTAVRIKKRCAGFLGALCLLSAGVLLVTHEWNAPVGDIEPLPVDCLLQNPELPNGCEATSVSMLLCYAGCPVQKTQIVALTPTVPLTYDGSRWHGADPAQAYTGNAEDKGFYCFAAPVAAAVNSYCMQQGSAHRAKDITGVTDTRLWEYLKQNKPVAVWITLDGSAPQYSSYTWYADDTGQEIQAYANLHCAVLTGMDQNTVTLADPLQGTRQMDKSVFLACFEQMGRRAVVVV